ncbi:MAG: imidazole glycerol phosphate synthase subunit HisH [Rhodobacteraceae bacterium]|nr:imidazole glycerol phosphate synthase subunit HisH [Paracoccaceae bacterium]
MSVVIIDYGSGNLHSAEKAFARMAAPLGIDIIVSADPDAVRRAERVMLPGVGAFGDCAAGLAEVPGLREALIERVIDGGAPFLGVCVGMQLMAEVGRERGEYAGLGWIPGAVEHLEPDDPGLKIPHMGWNALTDLANHPLWEGITSGGHAYFVHSYHMAPANPAHRLAQVGYGGPVTAAAGRDNLFGVQFHPEKSQKVGLQLIENFLRWRP